MFNFDRRTELSDMAEHFDGIIRNGRFFSVGKIPTRVPARLVPIQSPKYLQEFEANLDEIAGVICTADLVNAIPPQLACAVAKKPVESAFLVHKALCAQENYFWTDFASRIDDDAIIHPTAFVAEKNVVIGQGTYVGPKVVIMERSVIGGDCRIGAGTVVGADAFEMANINGRSLLQAHAGGVHIGHEVIFCANAAVARSIYPAFTTIGDNCGLDSLTQISHDCVVGAGSKLTACSTIMGRVEVGVGGYLGPNATVSNGLSVGANSTVTMGAIVTKHVPPNTRVTGNFAIDHDLFLANLKAITS
jgi:acyl-[acyl carrier protein]--UDP-N-acetylglucosamine O-acyltransferase